MADGRSPMAAVSVDARVAVAGVAGDCVAAVVLAGVAGVGAVVGGLEAVACGAGVGGHQGAFAREAKAVTIDGLEARVVLAVGEHLLVRRVLGDVGVRAGGGEHGERQGRAERWKGEADGGHGCLLWSRMAGSTATSTVGG